MNKHTFKVGDIIRYYFKNLAPLGTQGVVTYRIEVGQFVQIWSKALDRTHKGVDGWLDEHVAGEWVKHDTDFQVGDWVRYEQGDDVSCHKEGTIGQVVGLAEHCIYPCLDTTFANSVLRANLVKIQPPQEEKKMVIKRKNVDNVVNHNVRPSVISYDGCSIDGFYQSSTGKFFPASEWEPVEEWVKIEVKKCDMGDLPYLKHVTWRYPK